MRTKDFADRLHSLGYDVSTSSDFMALGIGKDVKCLIDETVVNEILFNDFREMGREEIDLINKYVRTPIDERNYKEFR